MNEKYFQFSFNTTEQNVKETLVALLSEISFSGFEETDEGLNAFIKETDFDENLFTQIASNLSISFQKSMVEQQNWNALWESSFDPVVVEDFVAVRAAFHQPIKNIQYEIIITPKMSFGTGHHATTFMMIAEMQHIDFTGKTVFDFGTGTGVLAILAEKLGAKSITAIDIDEWSIDNAKENIGMNDSRKIHLQLSSQPDSENKFEIILANINKNIIIQHIEILAKQLLPNGVLLLSGLLEEDESDINIAAKNASLQFIHTRKKDKWICMKFISL